MLKYICLLFSQTFSFIVSFRRWSIVTASSQYEQQRRFNSTYLNTSDCWNTNALYTSYRKAKF